MDQIVILSKDQAKGLIQLLSLASRVAASRDHFTDKDAYYIECCKGMLEDLVENGPVYDKRKLQIDDSSKELKIRTKGDTDAISIHAI